MNKIIFLSLLLFFFSCGSNHNDDKTDNSKYYKFIGEKYDSTLVSNYEGDHIELEDGVVPDAETAFKIAYIYAKRFYGDDIDKELPFQIELINNKLWHIWGLRGIKKDELYYCGGCIEIGIVKKTGKVYYIYHSK